ncbi:hypothetical protein [Alcaligenes sp. SORT26]|uniref:hypothetical protein n=1 Tax=Alcaligenes sp. SORT26 TaxID=2813780 RepID=UPI001FAF7B95|nr:hypothetical protein [Alcaligenes sp. SORT26]
MDAVARAERGLVSVGEKVTFKKVVTYVFGLSEAHSSNRLIIPPLLVQATY